VVSLDSKSPCDIVSDLFRLPAMSVMSGGVIHCTAHDVQYCTNACCPLVHSMGIKLWTYARLHGNCRKATEFSYVFDLRISGKVRTGLDLTLQGKQEQPSTYFETPGAQQRPRILSQLVKNSHRLPTLKLSFLFRSCHALPNANGNEIRVICNYVCTVIQSPPSYIKMLQYYNTTQTDVDTEKGEALGTLCCSSGKSVHHHTPRSPSLTWPIPIHTYQNVGVSSESVQG
jgi:hypothetical protein